MFGANSNMLFLCKTFKTSTIAVETIQNSPDSSGMAIFRLGGLSWDKHALSVQLRYK